MNPLPDKLMNKEDAEKFIKQNKNRFGSDMSVSICKQLLDVMRENERLREILEEILNIGSPAWFDGEIRKEYTVACDKGLDALNPNKDSING